MTVEQVVCLAWGSLVWRPKSLPVCGGWSSDGPMMPVEFARQSRDKRMTLVLCEGTINVPTLWCSLPTKSLDEGVRLLAKRERTARGRIGYVHDGKPSKHYCADIVGRWALDRGVAHVVWTGLAPRFENQERTPSADEVVEYLRNLEGRVRCLAEHYVRMTPQQIRTTYRNRIERDLGWTPATASG